MGFLTCCCCCCLFCNEDGDESWSDGTSTAADLCGVAAAAAAAAFRNPILFRGAATTGEGVL